jgi:hypothetical protein
VKKVFTTAYHPQGNGHVERMHRDLKKILRKLEDQNATTWLTNIPAALLALRTQVHGTTGRTPFELLFGRSTRLPGGWLSGTVDWKTEPSALMEQREKVYQEVTQLVEKKRSKNPRYSPVDQSPYFSVGERVWLWVPQNGRGGLQKNEGPYVIEFRVGEKTYRIVDPKGKMKRHPVVHQEKLSRAQFRNVDEPRPPSPRGRKQITAEVHPKQVEPEDNEEEDEDDEFLFRKKRGRRQQPQVPDQPPRQQEQPQQRLEGGGNVRRTRSGRYVRPRSRYEDIYY